MINCSTAVFKSAYVSHELPVKADERIFILFEMERIAKYKQKAWDSHKLCWAKNVRIFFFFLWRHCFPLMYSLYSEEALSLTTVSRRWETGASVERLAAFQCEPVVEEGRERHSSCSFSIQISSPGIELKKYWQPPCLQLLMCYAKAIVLLLAHLACAWSTSVIFHQLFWLQVIRKNTCIDVRQRKYII